MTDQHNLQNEIERLWENRENITTQTQGSARDVVNNILSLMHKVEHLIVNHTYKGWRENEWVKKANIL